MNTETLLNLSADHIKQTMNGVEPERERENDGFRVGIETVTNFRGTQW